MKYMTCDDVINKVAELDALKCLGEMSAAVDRYETQLNLRYRWQGN